MLKEHNSFVISFKLDKITKKLYICFSHLEYVPLFSSQKQWWRYYYKANFQTENSRDVSPSVFPKTHTQKEGFNTHAKGKF